MRTRLSFTPKKGEFTLSFGMFTNYPSDVRVLVLLRHSPIHPLKR